MPAADSVIQLYDFKGNIEPHFARLLESNLTVGAKSVVETRGTGTLTVPRIDVILRLGAATSHRFPHNGNLWPDIYECELLCRAATERDETSNASNLLVAQLRWFIAIKLTQTPDGRQLTTAALPYHVFNNLSEAGTQDIEDGNANLDYSTVTFKGHVSIRQDAWPSSS